LNKINTGIRDLAGYLSALATGGQSMLIRNADARVPSQLDAASVMAHLIAASPSNSSS
jgi:hypothetical protein